MEAHHPHPITHKKKWTEYLLEFFMLFLAVFLGFVAENIREHAVENERAKQYAVNLLQDLVADTVKLSEGMQINVNISNKADTLRSLIYSNSSEIPNGKFYYYGRYLSWYNRFTPNDATFQQMKSSGTIRYFHNADIERKLSVYDRLTRDLAVRETGEWAGMNEMWNIYSQLFYGNILDSILDLDKPRVYYEKFMANNYPLLNDDKKLFITLANLCRLRQMFIKFKIEDAYQPAMTAAKELITTLKNEYHFK